MNRPGQPEGGQSIEEIYDSFSLKAWDLPQVMTSFESLKRILKLDKLYGLRLYEELKPALSNVWKAKEVLSLLDKRAQQKEYLGQKVSKDVRVLIIGAGPVGLRLAIECILLGTEVIVIEKRTTFSRNNVLHLWPFTIDDLRHLGAKKFYGKFCAGAIDHISIRSLQCILLKICLLLGVQIHTNVEFVDVVEPDKGIGWRASVKPESHQVNKCEFDFIVDAGGARRIRIPCFDRKELRGKLALAITANFKNYGTSQEAAVDEISGVAFIFNQKFFKELKAQTRIDLENIVYYKDDTHYFVMTAKKDSLLSKGVLKADSSDAVQLLNRDNINEDNLCKFAAEAASWSTDLPKLDFAYNHHKKRDVALFDFTSIHQTEHAVKAIEKGGKVLYLCLVGDALLEPFWPQGTGCARGFLGAMDTAWLIRGVGIGRSAMDLLREREIVFQRLPQTTAQKLQKNTEAYTIDPRTRYTNLNLARKLRPDVMERLYKKSDSTASVLTTSVLQGTEGKSTSAEAASSKQVKQHEGKRNVLELPARQKGASNSSGQKPLLEKGTVHRAYYVNIDDFNTLKSHRELKLWLKKQVKPYGIEVANLSSSWSSGLALCALIHRYRPDLIPDIKKLSPENSVENNQLAFSVAEKHLGISSLIKPAEMDQPDRLALVTYLSLFYELFQDSKPATPPNEAGNSIEPPASKAPSVPTKESTPYKELKSSHDKTTSMKKSDKPVTKFTYSAKKGNSSHEDQAAHSSSELQIASTKKSQSIVEAQATSGVVTPTRKKTAVAEKKSASAEQQVASSDMQASADVPLAKHKSSASKPDDQVAPSVEPPVKTKKKKRKFRLFRRQNKKTNLATATPSVERRWTTVGRPRLKVSSKSRQKATELKESSQPEKDDKVSKKNLSTSSEGHQFKPSSLLSSDFCYFCGKRVYVMERMSANGCFFHRNCFRCTHCNCQLQMGNYTLSKGEGGGIGKFFCSPHYRQLFLSHPEVINYSRADPSKVQVKKLGSNSDTLHDTKVADLRSSSPLAPKKATKQDDDEVFSSEGEEVANITGKLKGKKSKKMSKKSKTRSESSKSPDVCESPETPTSSKPKRMSWFRKRSSSDSKALKSKSAERSGLPSDLTSTSASASPENIGQPKVVKKPHSIAGSNAGQVKKMSALFEALDKNTGTPPSTSERVGSATPQFRQLPAISEDSAAAQLNPTVAASPRSGQHHAADEKSGARPSAKTLKRGQKNLTRPVASTYSTSDVAIREYRKQQERFTEAQIIQREMSQIETQRDELEDDGRRIEGALRDTDESAEEDELMAQWVNLINERNGLERLAAELNLKMKELELEDRQYEIEKELNELAQISVEELTNEERRTFEELTEQKVAVVLERNKVVDQMEEERIQDQKEGTDAGFEQDYDSPGSSSETEEEFDLQDDQ